MNFNPWYNNNQTSKVRFMNIKNHGFSLVQVLISISILGGISLAFMQMMKNMDQGNIRAKSSSDEMELRSEINLILGNRNFCRTSLAGNGTEGNPSNPVTFKKVDIDQETEGLDLDLWLSNQQGSVRSLKKFSAADLSKNTYGNIKIQSIKLIMNNGSGQNYTSSDNHSDVGKVKVVIEKKQGTSEGRVVNLDFPVSVQMKTDNNGISTILSCSSQNDYDTSSFLKNCSWEKYSYSDAFRAYKACSNGKRVVSGTCSCASTNCGGGATPGVIYSFTPLQLSVAECVCTDWNCSNCNEVRNVCSGTSCNAYECSYTRQVGVIYMMLYCCDP
jgi:hypothetical protein